MYISLPGYYKIPHTEWLKHVNLFSHNSRDLKVQEQGGGRSQFPVRTLFWPEDSHLSLCLHMASLVHTQRESEWDPCRLYRNTNPIKSGHVMLSFDLDYFHKSKYSWMSGLQIYELWGDPNIKPLMMYNIFGQLFSSLNLWLSKRKGLGGGG